MIGLVDSKMSEGAFTLFSVSTPKLVGLVAPGGLIIRVREAGREEREGGRLGGGPEGCRREDELGSSSIAGW